MKTWTISLGLLGLCLATATGAVAAQPSNPQEANTWTRGRCWWLLAPGKAGAKVMLTDDLRAAVFEDWLLQDLRGDLETRKKTLGKCFTSQTDAVLELALVRRVIMELGSDGAVFAEMFARLVAEKSPAQDSRWRDLYTKAAEARRGLRLAPLMAKCKKIVFAKHFNMGGRMYNVTEGLSDAQAERHFHPGTALCLLEQKGLYGEVRDLIADPNGVIRDPDVSFDGKRILFSWKKDDRQDDYHLYEMEIANGRIRQLTGGLGFADFEGCYLPNGDILFNSSRCVQTVDCSWGEVSNLYTCDKDGHYLRRLGFDQVHTTSPSVLNDGRVIYTRWDYNDRGQIFPQSLFQMNPDGTKQTEFYGNNSWFPSVLLHARAIPGSEKIVAIATGHHADQSGKLVLIDPSKGRQENEGLQLIAPLRQTKAERVDAYGQEGDQCAYPYPLSEMHYLLTYSPIDPEVYATRFRGTTYGTSADTNPGGYGMQGYGLYFMDIDGRRELLAWDSQISCNHPVPLVERPRIPTRPSEVDYRKIQGTYYVQDVYLGPGLKGIPRGTIKSIRVVALEFRAAGIGRNFNEGPAGNAFASTPISIDNGAWDVKRVLGTAKVAEDGSACFTVPARTPVYFQLLDEDNCVVQSMRSWSTLQPGETFSCVGCHEDKNTSPPPAFKPQVGYEVQALQPFYGPPRGFSYIREIQPIWDKHCIRCHASGKDQPSLLGREMKNSAGRRWSESYLNLTQHGKANKLVNWLDVQSAPPLLPPYSAGAAKSGLMTLLRNNHYEVHLSREEMDKIACWIDLLVPYCGDYREANTWSPSDVAKYERFAAKRQAMEAIEAESIQALIAKQPQPAISKPRQASLINR